MKQVIPRQPSKKVRRLNLSWQIFIKLLLIGCLGSVLIPACRLAIAMLFPEPIASESYPVGQYRILKIIYRAGGN
jgi:hypothetical protein